MKYFQAILILIPALVFNCQQKARLVNPVNNPKETHKDVVLSVCFSPNGKWIASGGKDSDLFIWNGSNGDFIKKIRGNYDNIFDIQFLPDSQEILTANYNGNILKWNIQKGVTENIALDKDFISSLAYAADQKTFIASSWDSSITIFTPDGNIQKHCLTKDFKLRTVQYSESRKAIYAGTAKGYLLRWDYNTCENGDNLELQANEDAITSMDIDEEKGLLLTGSADKSVIIYSLDSMKPVKVLNGHTIQVNAVRFIHGENRVLSGDKDGKLYVWDIGSGQFKVFEAHTDSINSIDVSPNGKLVVTGSSDNNVKLWKLRDLK